MIILPKAHTPQGPIDRDSVDGSVQAWTDHSPRVQDIFSAESYSLYFLKTLRALIQLISYHHRSTCVWMDSLKIFLVEGSQV